MEMTKEMKEMMERTMEQYFAAYWTKHATPEQEAKRVSEGKTFKGAYHFCHTVAEKFRNRKNGENCVAMPDDLAYWILMHYMENEAEGSEYKTAEEIEDEKRRELEKAERKQKELEEKAAKLSDGSLVSVSAEDVAKAELEAEKAKEKAKEIRSAMKDGKMMSDVVAAQVEQMSLF